MSQNNDPLLNQLEAAHLLGITPELLFAYVRYAPREVDGRKLATEQHAGETLFRRSELLSFDEYLQEPWSSSGGDRATIPSYVLVHLKVECGGQCPRCGRGFKLETAHIEDYAVSRSHHHHNLIRLCSHCHDEFDSKKILPKGEIAALKERLVAHTRERLANRIATPNAEAYRPPTPAEIFVGRSQEVQRVVDGLKNRRVVCIKGVGGIGKTQLALHSVQQVTEQPRILWFDLESLDAVSDLPPILATAVLGAGDGNNTTAISAALDSDFDIVVFDGIEGLRPQDIQSLESFISQLASATKTARFLITSQVELFGIDDLLSIDVPPLRTDAAHQLLHVVADHVLALDNETNFAATEWLVQFADGHPLSLRLIANLLRYFKSPTAVLGRIKSMGAEAVSQPTGDKNAKHKSLDACFAVAYSVLQPCERRLLFILSHCPAGRFSNYFDPDLIGTNDLEMTIAELARWHFVTVDSTWTPVARIHVLSPVRAFAIHALRSEDANIAEQLFHELAIETQVQAAILDSRYTNERDPGLGTRRFNQEFGNFCYIFNEMVRRSQSTSDYDSIVCSLAFSLQVFCFVSGRSSRGLQIMDVAVSAALRLGQPGMASSLLLQVANFAQRMGEHAKARDALLRISTLVGNSADLELHGNVAFARGMLDAAEGRLEQAEVNFTSASEIYSRPVANLQDGEICGSNPRMHALALMERARICEHAGRESEALALYNNCLSLMISINDQVNAGTVLHQIGNCWANLLDYGKAYDSYVSSANCFFNLGSAIHLSNSLSELGYILIDHDPGAALNFGVTAEVLQAGLVDVFRDCTARYRSNIETLDCQECIGIIRKLFGLVALVSFTPHMAMLEEFAEALRQEAIFPLADQIAKGSREHPGDKVAIMHLDVMVALAGSLSVVSANDVADAEEIGHLANLCYIQWDYAWSAYRLFDWLATYLNRCRGWHDLKPSELLEAAAVSYSTGAPYRL